MDEKELDKFVEDQYKTWCDNNDISKVDDVDEIDLKEAIEEDLAFVSKMTVQEYTLYEKWVEVHEKYKTAETNSFFDDKPALVDPTQEAFIKTVKNNIWIPESPEDIDKLEPVLEFTDDTELNFKGQKKRGDLSEKWNTLRTFLSTMKNNSNIGRQMFFIVKDNRSGKYLGVICISGDSGIQILFFTSFITIACSLSFKEASSPNKGFCATTVGYFSCTSIHFSYKVYSWTDIFDTKAKSFSIADFNVDSDMSSTLDMSFSSDHIFHCSSTHFSSGVIL